MLGPSKLHGVNMLPRTQQSARSKCQRLDLGCEVLCGVFLFFFFFLTLFDSLGATNPVSLHILVVTCLKWKNKVIIFHFFKEYSHILRMLLASSFRGSVLYLWKWILCWHLNSLDLVSQGNSTSILTAMLWITFCIFCKY